MNPNAPQKAGPALRSIGAVAAETGIDTATLRVWERRYGFPKPVRRGSGHRLYCELEVERLRLIARALRGGCRAGQILRADPEEIEKLLNIQKKSRARAPEFDGLLVFVHSLDAEGLRREVGMQLMALGPRKFVVDYVAPLTRWVGESWARGELDVHEEHFITNQLQTILRGILDNRHEAAGAARIVLTTLPGEPHSLGLKMAAVILSFAGAAPRVLGPEMPLAGIVTAAKAANARAVGISVSAMSATRGTAQRLSALHEMLPGHVQLWAGGDGAARLKGLPRGIHKIRELSDLESAARQL